jgi:hypothetical protein
MILPMIKSMMFAATALLCFASQGYARYPFADDQLSDSHSVLVKADAPVADAVAGPAPVLEAKAEEAAEVGADSVIESEAAPAEGSAAPAADASADAPVDGEVAEADAAGVESSAPVSYRTVRPSRRANNGLVGELIELERRKNAWIRKNIFGR